MSENKKIFKVLITFVLLVSLCMSTLQTAPFVAAKRKPCLNKTTYIMPVGAQIKLKLKFNTKKVKWSSSKKKVASVNKSGLVKAKSKGKATITAKVKKKKYKCKITVNKKVQVIATQAPVVQVTNTPAPVATPVVVGTPKPYDVQQVQEVDQLSVRGVTISFGESTDSVISKLGNPSRMDTSEYDCQYMVYNDDCANLVMVAVNQEKVVGWYTDAAYFNYCGLSAASDINAVNAAFNEQFSLDGCLKHNDNKAKIIIYMDVVGQKNVRGIFVMSSAVKAREVTSILLSNWEKELLDLTNSFRLKNNLPALVWSDQAAMAARPHTLYQSQIGTITHVGANGSTSGERLKQQGIKYHEAGENVAMGKVVPQYNAFYLNNAWINSPGHRTNLLNTSFTYFGAGCCVAGNGYVFATQNFYCNRLY